METEVWKDIPWYEWLYKVSNFWNVYSCRNNILLKPILVKNKNKQWYYKVWLSKKKKFFIHRLVALSFLTQNHWKDCVNHIDWDTSNNKLSNLEWVSYTENNDHARKILKRWNFIKCTVIKNWSFYKQYSSIKMCMIDLWLSESYMYMKLKKWLKPYFYTRWYEFIFW